MSKIFHYRHLKKYTHLKKNDKVFCIDASELIEGSKLELNKIYTVKEVSKSDIGDIIRLKEIKESRFIVQGLS